MSPAAKKIRGRPSWATGSKLTFLKQYAEDWQKAIDAGLPVAGQFYTKVTKRFIRQYGFFFNRWEERNDLEILDSEALDEEFTQNGLSEDEVAKRHAYYVDLREVSFEQISFLGTVCSQLVLHVRLSSPGTITSSRRPVPRRRALIWRKYSLI